MTRGLRRFIFLIFVAFFIVFSILVVFFAQGYRFDFNTFKIIKTGGIFISVSTNGAKIYIDDKYVESIGGILNHNVLISNLAPKNYNVFIYKENYYPWNKIVEVQNGIATELNNIILFPIELKKIEIVKLPNQAISKFSVSNNTVEIKNDKTKTLANYDLTSGKLLSSEKFGIATSSDEIISPDKNKKLYVSDNQLWIEYLADGNKEMVANYESPINFFNWFSDSEHLIWFADGELSIAELDNRGGKRNSIKFYLNINPPVFWDRVNSDFYFFDKTTGGNTLSKISFKT